ncbi:hypothetical protein H0E87_015160 [Populus deltoides]|uniref:Uncharacterized protein n=1 Tax=Populus deltoides TaxID=3696 RepID=A0A8T2Y3V2_POPDE|nr:hypothetical protein H0E87_015160 [Populus deltoides]
MGLMELLIGFIGLRDFNVYVLRFGGCGGLETGRDSVPKESIVKSPGHVLTAPLAPTNKSVASKVLVSKPSVSDIVVFPILPQRTVLSTSLPHQGVEVSEPRPFNALVETI